MAGGKPGDPTGTGKEGEATGASSDAFRGDARLPDFTLPDLIGVTLDAETRARVMREAACAAATALDFDRLVVLTFLPAENLLRAVAVHGLPESILSSLRWTLPDFPAAERALNCAQPVPLSFDSILPAELALHLERESAVVPLHLGERPLAVLVGQLRPGVSARSAGWQARAREVAARSALFGELIRVGMAYQDELRLRLATREIGSLILEGQPLPEVAARITEIASEWLGIGRVGLYAQDTDGLLRPLRLRGLPADFGEGVTQWSRRSLLFRQAAESGHPVWARNVQEDPRLLEEQRAFYRRENITHLLLAVLRFGDTPRGTLVAYPEDPDREFTLPEQTAFQSFADMAALGVAIARFVQQSRDMATLAERNRLARELHDTVAQSLAGLVMQLETAQGVLRGGDMPGASALLDSARGQARGALEEARRAVQNLGPASLEVLSLVRVVERELAVFETEEVETEFLLTGEEQELTPDLSAAMLRIAQEALANARKHARARRVRVGLSYAPEEVRLIVEDDGVGFDMDSRAAPGPEGGYGLFGMAERARLLGGDVLIDSTRGWGTRVRARLPLSVPELPALPAPLRLPEGTPPPALIAPDFSQLLPRQGATASNRQAIRVLIVDDHALTRQGIRALLESGGDIVAAGEASDGAEAVERARALRPDVVLMDLQMPNMSGMEAIRLLQAEMPTLPVVVLTTMGSGRAVAEALQAGARGFLLKDSDPAEMMDAVRAAQRGETLLTSGITERLARLATGVGDTSGSIIPPLNEREREILSLLIQGARNKEIAARLFITTKTVEYHLSNLFTRLNVSNRTEAVRVALERGLVAP